MEEYDFACTVISSNVRTFPWSNLVLLPRQSVGICGCIIFVSTIASPQQHRIREKQKAFGVWLMKLLSNCILYISGG